MVVVIIEDDDGGGGGDLDDEGGDECGFAEWTETMYESHSRHSNFVQNAQQKRRKTQTQIQTQKRLERTLI